MHFCPQDNFFSTAIAPFVSAAGSAQWRGIILIPWSDPDTLRFSLGTPPLKRDKGRALQRGMSSFANARWFSSPVKCTLDENDAGWRGTSLV